MYPFEEVERMLWDTMYAVQAASPDVEGLQHVAESLWADLTRYGPPRMPENVNIPGLGQFNVSTPLFIPPPPPKTLTEKTVVWLKDHPYLVAAAISTGAAGLGYSGYVYYQARTRRVLRLASRDRREVVVVLGGDTALGKSLVLDLERQGYIVVTSVTTPEAGAAIERQSNGYVRALILDPNELGTIPIFLRSLASTLSRRFPITATGDPHASPSSHPYVHAVISLLTLPSPIMPTPLENLSLRGSYLPYLSATHIAPLQVIQALLPLLRTSPARGKDSSDRKNIIFCLPATDTRVGLPFASAAAMSAAATLKAAEVLRREIAAVSATDKTESMKSIKIVVVDVGHVATHHSPTPHLSPSEAYAAMEDWTASEKLVYGPALAGVTQRPIRETLRGTSRFKMTRNPTEVLVFTDHIVGVVSNGCKGGWTHGLGLGLGSFSALGRVRNWVRGERFAVGAGAGTYRIASHLPSILLDTILNIPHILIGLRNALMVRVGVVAPPNNLPRPAPRNVNVDASNSSMTVARRPLPKEPPHPSTITPEPESEHESESSLESSNLSDRASYGAAPSFRMDSDVDASWVSLNDRGQ